MTTTATFPLAKKTDRKAAPEFGLAMPVYTGPRLPDGDRRLAKISVAARQRARIASHADVTRRVRSVRRDADVKHGIGCLDAVPEEIAPSLLRAPVGSHTGLGIGLYQAARLAAAGGHALALESNEDGNVCFTLAPRPAGG